MSRRLAHAVICGLALAAAPAAWAESLRCNGQIIEVGDPRLTVMQKCGEPLLKDSYCRAVEVMPPPGAGRTPWYAGDMPCRVVDEWLYDRGPGNLMATVRFESGRIQAIVYSQR